MNKKELISKISAKSKITKSDAERALEATLSAITDALKKGQEIRLVNFGTFLVVKRKASKGRNPRTGAAINIPASKQPKFRPGKKLKDSVNK